MTTIAKPATTTEKKAKMVEIIWMVFNSDDMNKAFDDPCCMCKGPTGLGQSQAFKQHRMCKKCFNACYVACSATGGECDRLIGELADRFLVSSNLCDEDAAPLAEMPFQ